MMWADHHRGDHGSAVAGNFEFFSQELPSSDGSFQKSLWQRIVEARLGLVAALDAGETEPGLREETARGLQEFVAGMNLDNILVRPERRLVETYADWAAWESLTHEQAGDLAVHLAGLPSSARDDDEDAKRFHLLVLSRQLAQLEGDAVTAERLREQVQNIASGVLGQTSIPTVAEQLQLLDQVAGDEWWVDVTLPMLELARKRLRGLVRFLPKGKRRTVYTDFEDELAEHEDHPALQRLRRNQPLTASDLDELEEMLVASGAGHPEDIARAKEESQGLGLFVRSLVGLDRGAAAQALSRLLDGTTYSRAQIDFVGLIVSELTANGVMAARRLYESPFTDNAPSGPDYYFDDEDVDGIIVVLDQVRANASPDYTVAGA
jgi:type I restriction enzyme R subunit